jgi:1-acylglycerone phosphate reductase
MLGSLPSNSGFHVIATARRPEVMDDLRDAGMTVLPLDVTDSKSIANCKEQVRQVTGGRLDVLVNNA